MPTSIAGNSERGFTLLELIVVMALISLTAAFAVPQISSALFSNELEAAARRVSSLIAETGHEARRLRTALILSYDHEQHLFAAAPAGGAAESSGIQEVRLDDSVQVTGIAAAHRPESSDMSIHFDQRGYADRTAVHFRNTSGDEMTVLLSPFLGSIRIADGHVHLDDNRLTLKR